MDRQTATTSIRPAGITWSDRIQTELGFKLAFNALACSAMLAIYLAPQYLHFGEPRRIDPTWIDRIVPFDPRWTWIYVTYYALFPMVPSLLLTRADVRRYWSGVLVMYVIAATFFMVMPIHGPRPTDVSPEGLYAIIVRLDKNVNTLPSLHVAILVYAMLYFARELKAQFRPRIYPWAHGALWGWVLLVFYSTLATRQHYFIDIPTGAALGWFCCAAAYSRALSRCTLRREPA